MRLLSMEENPGVAGGLVTNDILSTFFVPLGSAMQ